MRLLISQRRHLQTIRLRLLQMGKRVQRTLMTEAQSLTVLVFANGSSANAAPDGGRHRLGASCPGKLTNCIGHDDELPDV